ncbi:MAG: hypothetical protein AB4911_13790 [Oscillochloridaceae bacterium umkhey_bin13]
MSYAIPPEDSRCRQCQQQLERFRTSDGDKNNDVSSCNEVLALALTRDEAAVHCLLAVTVELIRHRCPITLREQQDDWIQEIVFAITRKLHHSTNPYQILPPPPQAFIAYQAYLDTTQRHATIKYLQRQKRDMHESIDVVTVHTPLADPEIPAETIHKRLIFARLCDLIPEASDQRIFYLRFADERSTDEVVSLLLAEGWLKPDGNPYQKNDVSRSVERTTRKLSRIPEVGEMFESDGNS